MHKNQNATKKTLDTQHLHKIQEFHERDNTILKLQKDIENCADTLKQYKPHECSDDEFNNYMNVLDHYNLLKTKLEKMQNQDDEIDYYMNTAPILFQYYDILENGKDVTTIRKPITNDKSILKYFVKNDVTPEEKEEQLTPNIDRASLLDKYLHMTDTHYIKNMKCESRDKCPHCECNDRNTLLNDGMIYCNNCHTVEYIIIDHERPSYKDPPHEIRNWFEKQYAWINWKYIQDKTFRTFQRCVQLLVC